MTQATGLLASAARSSSLFVDLLPWLGLLLALVIVGGVVMLRLRRAIYTDRDDSAQGFTLQDLRELRDSGQLSEDEFDQARAAMIGRVHPGENDDKTDKPPQRPGNGGESATPEK